MSDAAKLTPMMQQYFEVKDENFSPVFWSCSFTFNTSEAPIFMSTGVRGKTPNYTHPGITRRV